MADIYISYAQSDRKRGEALQGALQARGYSTHLAPRSVKPEEMRAALSESAAAIVCWSRANARAAIPYMCAAQAFNQGKLISVLFTQPAPPAPYDRVSAFDLTQWRGESEAGLDDVLAGVAKLASPRPPGDPRPAPAPSETRPASKPQNLFAPATRGNADDQPEQATRVAASAGDAEEGARSPVALIAIAAMALVIAALWAGPRVFHALQHSRTDARAHAAIVAARDDLPPVSSTSPPAPAAEEEAPPPASSPVSELATPIVTPVGAPSKRAGAPTPAVAPSVAPSAAPSASPGPDTSAAPSADPPATMTELETCLAAIAKQCPRVDPAIAGEFAVDGRVTAGKRRMLSAPLFPDRSLVTKDNLKACRAIALNKPSAHLRQACAAIAPKGPAASPSARTLAPSTSEPSGSKLSIPSGQGASGSGASGSGASGSGASGSGASGSGASSEGPSSAGPPGGASGEGAPNARVVSPQP